MDTGLNTLKPIELHHEAKNSVYLFQGQKSHMGGWRIMDLEINSGTFAVKFSFGEVKLTLCYFAILV